MPDKPEIDYGPLAGLIGTWEGDKGLDVAPEPDGTEESLYYETIVFEGAGTAQNAESQTLAVVRYHQVVQRKSNDEVFHDQVGYWMWDAAQGVVMQSLAIPRAVCVVAGGKHAGSAAAGPAQGAVTLQVCAKPGDDGWGIAQSPFMRDNARTLSFEYELTVDGNRLTYEETTMLEIYGRTFEHTDCNELARQ